MSWLRIDDAMPVNGKLGDLTDAEFRALLALWAYCARKGNGGTFVLDELRHAIYTTPRGPRCVRNEHLSRFLEVGLVATEDGGVFAVNDWGKYQPKDPTSAERKRRWRDRSSTVP
jgi:hypothetical protein